MDSIQVTLKGPRNESVPAVVRSINLMRDGLAWFVSWFPKMFDLSGRRLFQDSHWDIAAIWTEPNSNTDYRVKVIEANDEIQGFLVVKVNGYIGIDGKPCA